MREVFVLAEQQEGRLVEVSLEILQKASWLAKELRGSVSAILIGYSCGSLADELIHFGADKVFLADESRLEMYQSDVYTNIVSDVISDQNPEILLVGGTSVGLDIAPRLAARLQTGLTAHCVDLYIENIDGKEQLIQVVPGWGGRMMVKIICPDRRPQMSTVRPGVMDKGTPDSSRTGEVITLNPVIDDSDFKAKTLEFVREDEEGVSLEHADIIVSGGFGLYSSDGFQLIKELAQALQAEVAGTRPAFDHGWILENQIIGQSGKNVHPRLFISVGASGAVHYTTGFLKSSLIVGIDKNPHAPIFDISDLGIIGDLKKIIPCIIAELKQKTS